MAQVIDARFDVIKPKKTGNRVNLIGRRDFKEYRKDMGLKREDAVVYNTTLHEMEEKELEDHDGPVLRIGNRYYELYEKKDEPFLHYRRGYIALSENEFVCVWGWLLLLFLLGLLLIGMFFALLSADRVPGDADENPNGLSEDGSQRPWNGEQPNIDGEVPEQEDIRIPGFYKFTATDAASNVPLYNPPENTVYFQYEVYVIHSSETVATYGDASEAKAYIDENQAGYTISKDGSYEIILDSSGEAVDNVDYYKTIPAEDGSFYVVKEDLSILYATDLVSPGNQVVWDAAKSLDKGDYTLKFIIRTFDTETKAECYGAVQTVEAHIE